MNLKISKSFISVIFVVITCLDFDGNWVSANEEEDGFKMVQSRQKLVDEESVDEKSLAADDSSDDLECENDVCNCPPGWAEYINFSPRYYKRCRKCNCGEGFNCTFYFSKKRCNCPEGYFDTGVCEVTCERDEDCKSDARCMWDGNGASMCYCQPGTYGERCEDVFACRNFNKDCGPDATCAYDVATNAACKCKDEILEFDEKTKTCYKLPCTTNDDCKNGGQCIEQDDKKICSCPRGTSGHYCEEVRICHVASCYNEDTYCGYHQKKKVAGCICKNDNLDYDWYNKQCKISHRTCDLKVPGCRDTGGFCYIGEDDDVKCLCKKVKEYVPGEGCKISKNECIKNVPKCLDTKGKCYSILDVMLLCKCPSNLVYSEEYGCQAPCFINQCANGGTCQIENNKEVCICKGPYSGRWCDRPIESKN